jgi:HD superfamily phosphohydrolase
MTIAELSRPESTIRIPDQRSVPVTGRLLSVIDHPVFQRLRRVRQLGPIYLVYPGAVHTRFEHSLGVYDLARRYLLSLLRDENVAASLTEEDIITTLLGALLHDIGHYPFAHSLEALHHPGRDTPRHEDLFEELLFGRKGDFSGPTLASVIESGFGIDPMHVAEIVGRKPHAHERPERRLVATIISSGIDADKADYLERDSIHMGVSYGRNYDRSRMLDSLCVHPDGDRIAMTDKGRICAEMFTFCRYTMFSEAYWHHTVRSVSAMVERAFDDYQDHVEMDLDSFTALLLRMNDDELMMTMRSHVPADSLCARLLGSMTSGNRDFYRRLLTLSRAREDQRQQTAWERIYNLDRQQTRELRVRLCQALSSWLGVEVSEDDMLIDTPPRDKDRIETVDIVYGKDGRATSAPLPQVSRVVQGIASDFVRVVKKIRIFVSRPVRQLVDARGTHACQELLLDTILEYVPGPQAQQSLL